SPLQYDALVRAQGRRGSHERIDAVVGFAVRLDRAGLFRLRAKTARDRAAGVRGRADAISLRRQRHGVAAGYRRGADGDTVFRENLEIFRSIPHRRDVPVGVFDPCIATTMTPGMA